MDTQLALFSSNNPRPDLGLDYSGPAMLVDESLVNFIDNETIEYLGHRYRKNGIWHTPFDGAYPVRLPPPLHWRYNEI